MQARKLHANFNEEVTLRDVVLSSSAIPTIFPLHSFKYSGKFGTFADANIVADNPVNPLFSLVLCTCFLFS